MHRRTLLLALGSFLLVAVPSLARPIDAADALARMVEDARRASSPAEAFLGALADLPDSRATGADLRAALRRAGVPAHPLAGALLGDIAGLEKRGTRLIISNSQARATEVVLGGEPKGWVTLERTVTVRVRREGEAVVLDEVTGLWLSRKRDSFRVSLKRVRVGPEGGRRVAKVTAGLVWPLQRTVTVDLRDPTRLPLDEPGTPGLAGSLR